MEKLSGRCFCRAVTWSLGSEPLWAAHCHCEDCRRAASSDYVSWLGVLRTDLSWTGPIERFTSSPGVTRGFCKECGSPAFFQTEVFPDETHLYAATLEDPSQYRPTAHIFWAQRVPWLQVWDSLPKHDRGLQDAAKIGRNLVR